MSEQLKSNPEQKVVLTLGDLQVVLNYLSIKPYAEVLNIVETIKKARTFESVTQELALAEKVANVKAPIESGAV